MTPHDTLPPVVAHLTQHWPAYIERAASASAAVEALSSEAEALGACWSPYTWSPLRQASLESLTRDAFDVVTRLARKELCAGDDTLLCEEDVEAVFRDAGIRTDATAPDFGGYWQALFERFGGGRGASVAHRRWACELAIAFGIQRDGFLDRRAPKSERGGVTFHVAGGCLHYTPRLPSDGLTFHAMAISRLAESIFRLGELAGDRFPVADCLRLFRRTEVLGYRSPIRVVVGPCQWTFTKTEALLWVPMDMAVAIRDVIESAQSA
ncbi:hypothetical protein E4T66_17240 [Sinimarinibacterium sp. CAU 1509]|uniref:hypothetical protein n=1 Tax=Sinimarinibacterium sp. CAU 1509 TaxID=2562283 RepID=UPI0010ACFA94|nr:hypothetical protein [Sinimarinibacterium sp. CAU 1509]TJY57156.1 hypothetical protein E4T66_17240 [Sinimarinibacterium sp. CAU 1509]